MWLLDGLNWEERAQDALPTGTCWQLPHQAPKAVSMYQGWEQAETFILTSALRINCSLEVGSSDILQMKM